MQWGYKETKRWTNTAGVQVSEGIAYLNGQEFIAISGGGGKGPLPAGKYKIQRAFDVDNTNPKRDAYMLDGLAFFSRLDPTFKTDRTFLGVHADGKAPGTLGCVGLKNKIKEANDILKAIPFGGLDFEVIMLA